jgi:hypothetical protein
MVPCLGTAMAITAGRPTYTGWLVANRAAVGIGLISYSLYLVHWPLLTLYRYSHATGTLSERERVSVVLASILIATAMYFLVERPFRRTRQNSRRLGPAAFGLSCAGWALALMLAASEGVASHGWPGRLDARLQSLIADLPRYKDEHFRDVAAQAARPFPAPGRRNGAIIGDSHAADLMSALISSGSSVNFHSIQVQFQCQPVLGARPFGEGTPIRSREIAEECRRQGDQLKDSALLRAADVIVIASTWTPFGLEHIASTLDYFKATYKARLLIIGPRYYFDDPSRIISSAESYDDANRRFDASKNRQQYDGEWEGLARAASAEGVDLIDVRPLICESTGSGFTCPLLREDARLMYWDSHHWTSYGAAQVGARLKASGRYSYLF